MIKSKSISFLLLSISIFTYQNLLGPTFSTLLTGLWQAWVVIPSFLGIGLGLWVTVSFLHKKISLEKLELFGYFSLSYSYIFVFIALSVLSKSIDQDLISASAGKAVYLIETIIGPVMRENVLILLSITMIPFLFFGLVLGIQFCKPNAALGAYKSELLAILIGTAMCVYLLEAFSWTSVVYSIVSLSFISILLQGELFVVSFWKNNYKSLTILTLVLFSFIFSPSSWEIQRNLNLIARDFHQNTKVTALATRWKSFAKVQLLDQEIGSAHRKMISIGDGTGIAKIFPYGDGPFEVPNLVTVNLSVMNAPKKALVLFAGAGAELVGIHKALKNEVETWGIEINSAIPKLVAETEGVPFEQFFKNYRSHYIVSDNRKFLETTLEKFDTILYSWSGATVANFTGAILHTTQYSFSVEALKAATGKLNKDGILIVMGGNKLNILMALKKLQNEGNLTNVKDKVLLFALPQTKSWKASWDNFVLIYKNGIWSSSDIQKAILAAGPTFELVLQPGQAAANNFTAYQRILAADYDKIGLLTNELWIQEKILPTVASDNYPFAYRNFPSAFSNNAGYWSDKISSSFKSVNYDFFDGIIWTGIIFLILLFISMRAKTISASSNLLQFLAWAPLSSACYLFFLYKAILYFGEPTTAFLIVQASVQIGSLIGLRLVKRLNASRVHPFAIILVCMVFLSAVVSFQMEGFSNYLFNLNSFLTAILFIFVILTISAGFTFYFMGNFLSQSAQGSNHFGLFWSFETLFTGIMCLLGALLIEEIGLKLFVIVFVSIAGLLLAPAMISGTVRKPGP